MGLLDSEQLAFFDSFGFVVVRGFFTPDQSERLFAEVVDSLTDQYPQVRRAREPAARTGIPVDGVTSWFLPLMNAATTPASCALVNASPLRDVAEQLLGADALVKPPKGTYLSNASPWHQDTTEPHLRAVKCVVYRDELCEADGSLQFLPGSHRGPLAERLAGYREEMAVDEEFDELGEERRWPGFVPPLGPHDVVVFDPHIWHGSVHGRARFSWTTSFVAVPETPEQRAAAHRYIAQFLGQDFVYDQERFPYYDPRWSRADAPPFVRRMRELDVL
ncbi:Ectoine hydroxylase-related dioxygenase, phytanoyl-CoA dioxygenase (PhyH) family [Streptomyces zhaozhouensis]|uniref:Ectoine hydroxylase-related dioxygenase, phytanoyl-CoA dioxygenase (PhyH) family n=1 Tax=Streptomyces zhaozhouensis TaxID=1300267 RepID=A0A286DVZ9_9ACTN|nr:phytanoyl-CoA dioxygenase family protein [Streptomyces zhaozhouensis]SOD62849.1 Ectoine hydroxylase-related dioxygenase, phytanoyl-CoA dioxygenase (PhyH) family [Streptomyces zhaozhouensis]